MKPDKKYKTKHEEDAKKLGLCVKFFGLARMVPTMRQEFWRAQKLAID